MNKRSSQEDDHRNDERDMNIEVGHLSVTGHVVFAGRDGQVNVSTGGDVAQHTTQTITVGGVETTREALDSMIETIRGIDEKIEEDSLDEESKEAAEFDLRTIEDQLTGIKKPNGRILVTALKSLYRLSPVLASGIMALFGEPLVAQIIAGVGGIAVQFYDMVLKKKPK